MHPALSVIFFTTATGAGYGMLFWLGILGCSTGLPRDGSFGPVSLAVALAFVTGGLISSMFHLGHPERAWRAVSQWRSSWLSREGASALITYIPALALAAALVWHLPRPILIAAAAFTSLGAVATVVCSAYIYRSLKPIQRWANNWVLPNYLALAAATGALWLAAIAAFLEANALPFALPGLCSLIPAAILKLGYWRFIDKSESISTAETATGLGAIGRVRLLDPPHTSDNYLLKEMGFRIARKHAPRLRRISFLSAFLLPFVLILAGLWMNGVVRALLFLAAALLATFGVLIERWLFFAEARHTVMLYYGAERA